MKKIVKILIMILSFGLLAIFGSYASSKVLAETRTYETPDYISVEDLTGLGELNIRSGTTKVFDYTKTADHGSLVFTFKADINKWEASSSYKYQIYFVVDNGAAEPWWNEANVYQVRGDGTYLMREKEDSSFGYKSTSAVSAEDHLVEYGRLAIKENGTYTGKYYCYIKVDGTEILSCENTYDYTKLLNQIHITSTGDNNLIDPNYVAPTYEDADEISISDLKIGNKNVGNKIVLSAQTAYSYNRTATYGSTILRFTFKNTKWTGDSDGCQIHLYNTWQEHGVFWLRPDHIRICYKNGSDSKYIVGNPITAGSHEVEVGRLAILKGEEYTGNHYLYIKIDGTLYCEYVLTGLDSNILQNNGLFLTGSNGNLMLDKDWTGDQVTFKANNEVYSQFITTDDHISAPAVDPTCPGKTFIGWFDAIGNKWDFENDSVTSNLVLTAGFKDNNQSTVSDEVYFADENYEPVLRFMLSSDVHFSQGYSNRNALLEQAFQVAYSYAAENTTYSALDAALFVGDISDDGSKLGLTNFKNTASDCLKDGTILVISMGNHDFRSSNAAESIANFYDVFGTVDTHIVINGFHFIALSPNTAIGEDFTQEKADWLDEQLAIAVADTPTKPVFVMQHEGIRGTIYGSEAWGVDILTDVLVKYPQVVDFSGHSHYPLSDPRSIWQGTFTALGTGTLHYYEVGINNYKKGGIFPSDKNGGWANASSSGSTHAEFQIIEVDANNAMRVIVYDLTSGREITRYYLRNLLDERKTTYSFFERSQNAQKPDWATGTVLTATPNEDTITLTFNQAICEDIVESYRIELWVNGTKVETRYALSDYFFYPMPETLNYKMEYLSENTEYTIKVYAVNVWGDESVDFISATCKTGEVPVQEDVVDEITLRDLISSNTKKYLTTDTLNTYVECYFVPSEKNVYGSFRLSLQLLNLGEDWQICFNETFANSDLVWINQEGQGVWFVKDGFKSGTNIPVGLHTVVYERTHINEGKHKGYTALSVYIDGELIHTLESERKFTTNGHICLNFRGAYGAGSRYYNIDDEITRTTTPSFVDGYEFALENVINNGWNTLGGEVTFVSKNPSLTFHLEDENGQVSTSETFEGTFVLGTTDSFYSYKIKTNKFGLKSGASGDETITKICCEDANWKVANVEFKVYPTEKLADYDEVNILDLNITGNTGYFETRDTETQYAYAGTSETFSGSIKYYICVGKLTSTCEFRVQFGTIWKYGCTLWIQPGDNSGFFFGWDYTTRPTDKYTFAFKENTNYLVEMTYIKVVEGEYEGYTKTSVSIDGNMISSFYGPEGECVSENYQVCFKCKGGYSLADASLGRTINYKVDNETYKTVTAVNGATTLEPTMPTKPGLYFTGWYTAPTGGDRVDFSKPVNASENIVNYYARFSDTKYDVKFYDENDQLIDTQEVGKDGQAISPIDPTKTGEYVYTFVNWIDKATQQPFNFKTPITQDVELKAQFEEYRYKIVYLVDGVKYATRYYLESEKQIIDGEPEVPTLVGASGYWIYSDELGDYDLYVKVKYNGTTTTPNDSIKLNTYNGASVDIADDLTRFYLSFADTNKQGEWIDSYPISGGHERQDITFSWTDSTNNKEYLVYFADNIDFTNAFIVKTNTKSLDYVGIFTPGKTYYWKVIGLTNNYASSVDTFEVLNTPVRWISADTVYNMRDIGGWTTTDGKVVNYGMVYRGGQLSLDNAGEQSYMSNYSFKVFDYLDIKTEIELRGDQPHDYNQINDLERLILVNGTGYTGFFNLNAGHKEDYQEVFAALADESNYPFYFHCSWGADRTGGLGFLINAVLGVPFEQLVQDYELTSLSYSGRRTRNGYDGGAFMNMYNMFMSEWSRGGTIQDAVYNYLVEYVGVAKSNITKMKALLLSNQGAEALDTYTVTYVINGDIYQQSKVFAGSCVKEVAPVFFDKYLSGWTVNGEPFDLNTEIYQDITLEGVFSDVVYDEYDEITLRDLYIENTYLSEGYTPKPEQYFYEGFSSNGGRIFTFNYYIDSTDGLFDDGVHVEIGDNTWNYKAHLWIAGSSQHIFTNGASPTATYNFNFEDGKTYKITVGVVNALNGPNAGKKMFIFMINDKIMSFIPTTANIGNNFNICFAGTEGKMYSVDNLMDFSFFNEDGTLIETKYITRGTYATAITSPTKENKVFLGWYDELGNEWNFSKNKVLKDIKLFAKFGDKTIKALLLDENDIEISHDYQVKVSIKVSEIITPNVDNEYLEFNGWYNGNTKLADNTIITEDMNLIARYKVIEKPVTPVDPVDPVKPNNGCKNAISSSIALLSVLSVCGLILLKKKKELGE